MPLLKITRPYGTTDPIYFPLFVGAAAQTGLSFSSGDMKFSVDGGSASNTNALPTEVSFGWYKWTPVAAETQGKVACISLIDAAGGPTWDDLTILIETHGAGTTTFGFDLSASAPDVNLFSVNDSQANAIRLGELIGTSRKGTIKSATTPTATEFQSANFEVSGDDLMNTRMGVFITGTYAGMPFFVLDQETDTPVSGTETFTVAPMPNVPSAGNEFIIL